ncbi:hypothetical protein MicvaDRAFT_0450 [Microcoleus vaginatus FGP-2]|nr:hypothetical protein MicvaDRAFT_0450 [Microcoleus vaginatus FGP-2]
MTNDYFTRSQAQPGNAFAGGTALKGQKNLEAMLQMFIIRVFLVTINDRLISN